MSPPKSPPNAVLAPAFGRLEDVQVAPKFQLRADGGGS